MINSAKKIILETRGINVGRLAALTLTRPLMTSELDPGRKTF